ncbi:glycosyltransferase family 2 protein [Nguyenibacter vanlangensis]|uniref:Glycosyltransferase family 2 protein n=1 Tax=Nguyenibacter vanlangensis TaxID=1216886 RepID=A0A7Y7IVN8_9PROT|nr:glycosyltransferase family 2 protein [Nguyenibacter vanlangensis]NVN11204.1 glycosyltransferase family 2 protein [Nguyenibacter vanlangensis]
MTPYSLDVVIPCYNEEDALPVTLPRILSYLDGLQSDPRFALRHWRVILVDDGSADRTWTIIAAHAEPARVVGLKLSRNFGHQNAMLAGLSHADADAVITMDCDLQDDINAIEAMLLAYQGGFDLALGVRSSRTSDTIFKKGTARAYYRLLTLFGVNVIEDHADYRLMSQRALRVLLAHNEVNLFLRGIIPTIGFKTSIIPYERQAREFGNSKYTLGKMLALAIDGITSFSVLPLRMIAAFGVVVFLASSVTGLWVLLERLVFSATVVSGWASVMLPLLALGGLQILSIGVLGEYIGKIYLETKRRPRFIVETVTDSPR